MNPSGMNPFANKALIQPTQFFSGFRVISSSQDDDEEREPLIAGGSPLLPSLHHPSPLCNHEAKSLPTPDTDGITLSQQYARMAQELLPSLLSLYQLLNPHDVKLTGERPIAAGGFTDIWEAIYFGRKVVLKSYRCYISFDVAHVIAVRFGHLR